MQKQKYSIEFSHIYADQVFEDKQLGSVAFLNDLLEVWRFDYSTIILIDDYNIDKKTLNENELLSKLTKLGIKPDFWAFEKDLISYTDDFFKTIEKPRVRSRYERYYSKKNKYPCSFLTAIWYSVRMGIFDADGLINSTVRKKFRPTDRLLNILAEDFKDVEHETIQLLSSTSHSSVVPFIQNLYYETPVRSQKTKQLKMPEVF